MCYHLLDIKNYLKTPLDLVTSHSGVDDDVDTVS